MKKWSIRIIDYLTDDTLSLYIFDFALSAQAKAGDSGRIVIITDKLPSSLASVIPSGRDTIDFLITS